MDLLERAEQIIKNINNVGNAPYDGGIHPNDFRVVVREWLDDYETELEQIKNIHVPQDFSN